LQLINFFAEETFPLPFSARVFAIQLLHAVTCQAFLFFSERTKKDMNNYAAGSVWTIFCIFLSFIVV
jgi:hypothetical protein